MTTRLPAPWTDELLDVLTELSRAGTPGEVADAAVTAGAKALGAKSATLRLLSESGTLLEVAACVDRDDPAQASRNPLPIDARDPACDAFREGRLLIAERGAGTRGPAGPRGSAGMQLAIPLVAAGRPVGCLSFGFSDVVPIPAAAVMFVRTLALRTAEALGRAPNDSEQRARRRLEILAEVTEAFNAPGLTTSSALDIVVQRVAAATGDTAVLQLGSSESQWLVTGACWSADPAIPAVARATVSQHRERFGEGLAGRAASSRETLIVTTADPAGLGDEVIGGLRAYVGGRPVRGAIVVPLIPKGRLIGTLTCLRTRSSNPYCEADRLLLEQLAARAAAGIDRTRLYQEVVRSQRLFEGIADASPDVLYLYDLRTGRNVFASRSVEQVLGRTARDVAALGEHYLETLVHPDDRERLTGENARFAKAGDTELVEHEFRIRHADGSWRWVRSRDRIFSRTSTGEPELVLGILRDVTENVRSEKEREELLAREQQARRDAETASRAKDEFLAMLGHELRNPLSPMITALDLMKLYGANGLERERTIIERQVRHLTRLVDDLLDVSRITRGMVELKRRPFEMAKAISAAIEMTSPLLETRRHHVEVDVARRGLPVLGDPDRLAQVVANLLTNAAKYTEPGGRIAVRAWREGKTVAIRVQDSGMGISPALLPRIFDLFVQGTRALDRAQGGLGLGLTIVRSLVALHGGDVSVSSAGAGRGSEFTVRLPVMCAAEAALTPPPIPSQPVTPPPIARTVRVLVVDDNEDAADALVEALGRIGYDVRVAYDGPRALESSRISVPDVAFLDIGLPVMDGYELGRRLREQLGAAVKLVALTGYGQDRDRARSRAAGFDEHVVKPVDLPHIVSMLQRLVHRDAARPVVFGGGYPPSTPVHGT